MASRELEHLIHLVDTLSDTDRLALATYLAQFSNDLDNERAVPPYTDDELRAMMSPTPKKGREIVAAGRRSGAIGSWADMNISDPAAWLRQQRPTRFLR